MAEFILPLSYSEKAAKLDRVRRTFPNVPPSLITESFLQKEIATSNTQNLYEFNFNGNANDVAFTTEQLLEKNNVFVVTDIWYGLAHEPASTSDYATKYFTWPDFVELETTAGAAQIDLEIFWNAKYAIETGLMEQPVKSCRDHYFAPTTDQLLVASGGLAALNVRAGQIQGNYSGFVSQEPMSILSGAATQAINLNVGTGYSTDVTASSGQIRVVFRLGGFLVFNGAISDSVQDVLSQIKKTGVMPA